jgi:transcriptional regulator with XRE-family HTH domain
MHVGYHIMAWRRWRKLTQADLAERANLGRPYLSRLEKQKADPSLSSLRRLAQAMEIQVGRLIDELPPEKTLSREQLDRLARGALRPGTTEAHAAPETRVLARLIRERRKALGFYVPRTKQASSRSEAHVQAPAVNASRWLRAALGERQWDALLRRIDKLASSGPPRP